jgi:glucan phosphoethanolaminetransferase (alkaline phosphatase superfamily)
MDIELPVGDYFDIIKYYYQKNKIGFIFIGLFIILLILLIPKDNILLFIISILLLLSIFIVSIVVFFSMKYKIETLEKQNTELKESVDEYEMLLNKDKIK